MNRNATQNNEQGGTGNLNINSGRDIENDGTIAGRDVVEGTQVNVTTSANWPYIFGIIALIVITLIIGLIVLGLVFGSGLIFPFGSPAIDISTPTVVAEIAPTQETSMTESSYESRLAYFVFDINSDPAIGDRPFVVETELEMAIGGMKRTLNSPFVADLGVSAPQSTDHQEWFEIVSIPPIETDNYVYLGWGGGDILVNGHRESFAKSSSIEGEDSMHFTFIIPPENGQMQVQAEPAVELGGITQGNTRLLNDFWLAAQLLKALGGDNKDFVTVTIWDVASNHTVRQYKVDSEYNWRVVRDHELLSTEPTAEIVPEERISCADDSSYLLVSDWVLTADGYASTRNTLSIGDIDPYLLQTKTHLELVYDLNGLTLRLGAAEYRDASAIVFTQYRGENQSSWHVFSLAEADEYGGVAGFDGEQTIMVPLDAFLQIYEISTDPPAAPAFDSLDRSQPVDQFHIHIWHEMPFTVEIKSVTIC